MKCRTIFDLSKSTDIDFFLCLTMSSWLIKLFPCLSHKSKRTKHHSHSTRRPLISTFLTQKINVMMNIKSKSQVNETLREKCTSLLTYPHNCATNLVDMNNNTTLPSTRSSACSFVAIDLTDEHEKLNETILLRSSSNQWTS
jgi:hypothetical protein